MTNPIFDLDEASPTDEEVAAAEEDARKILRVWKRRAVYSAGAFVLSCASAIPFLYGYPLHRYWEDFGKYLVLLSMALLLPFMICIGIAINSWTYLRNLTKIDA